jgi:hypothetical protein
MRAREIGSIGTAARVVVGAAAIALPIALDGIGWWDAPALAAAPVVAAGLAALITRALGGIAGIAGCALIAALFAAAYLVGEATPAHGDVVFWGFFGASMLLGALRGDGGCEVLAFPNAITGRRDRIGCILFTPIDTAEARLGQRVEASR